MRSALLEVDGVTRARVQLEGHEALVEYDAQLTAPEALIAAIAAASGPAGPSQFRASVKEDPHAAPSAP